MYGRDFGLSTMLEAAKRFWCNVKHRPLQQVTNSFSKGSFLVNVVILKDHSQQFKHIAFQGLPGKEENDKTTV